MSRDEYSDHELLAAGVRHLKTISEALAVIARVYEQSATPTQWITFPPKDREPIYDDRGTD